MGASDSLRQKKIKFFVLYLTHPHVCRHTYCTNMAKTGISAKTLQYLMGHSDIQITLNVYTHIGFDHAKEELNKMPNIEKELKSTTRRNGRKVANL